MRESIRRISKLYSSGACPSCARAILIESNVKFRHKKNCSLNSPAKNMLHLLAFPLVKTLWFEVIRRDGVKPGPEVFCLTKADKGEGATIKARLLI